LRDMPLAGESLRS